jgi:Rieske Fe-S protein
MSPSSTGICDAADGVQHQISPVCPHLGGIVNWNDVDKTRAARCTDRDSRQMVRSWMDRPPTG